MRMPLRLRLKIAVAEQIYRLLRKLEERIADFAERFAFCDSCGRNRFRDEPCGGQGPYDGGCECGEAYGQRLPHKPKCRYCTEGL